MRSSEKFSAQLTCYRLPRHIMLLKLANTTTLGQLEVDLRNAGLRLARSTEAIRFGRYRNIKTGWNTLCRRHSRCHRAKIGSDGEMTLQVEIRSKEVIAAKTRILVVAL